MTPLETIGFIWGMNTAINIFAILRFYTQLTKGRRRFTASDWITLAVVITVFANTCLNTRLLVLNQRGSDRAKSAFEKVLPIAALNKKDYEEYWKLVFSTALITYGELWGIKATFCAIYLELANRLSLALKIMLGVLIAIVVGSFIVSFHALANQCRPVARIWKNVFDPEYCIFYTDSTLKIYFWASIAADIAIILFSLRLISTLRMRARFVRSMFFVIFVGCISIAASIARFVSLLRVLSNPLEINNNAELGNIWAYIEVVFGFIASCLPVFRVYMRERSASSAGGSSAGKWSARVARGIGMESWSLGLSTKSSGGNTVRRSVAPGDHDEDHGNIILVERGGSRPRESRDTHETDPV